MQVQSYLFFNGRCEEAIEFYKKTLGAKVEMLMRFSDSPEKSSMPVQPNPNKHHAFVLQDRRYRDHGVGRHAATAPPPNSKASRFRSAPRTRPTPAGCSPRSPKAARCISR